MSSNPNAIHILEKNLDKIDWYWLSRNPNAIHLLEKNPDKIHWFMLSLNPNAIHLLEKNQDKIDWNMLCENLNGIHLLEKNQDKVDWYMLSKNPNIFMFEYDYEKMKYNMDIIGLRDELMSRVFDPERLKLISKNYKIGIRDLIQIYS